MKALGKSGWETWTGSEMNEEARKRREENNKGPYTPDIVEEYKILWDGEDSEEAKQELEELRKAQQ